MRFLRKKLRKYWYRFKLLGRKTNSLKPKSGICRKQLNRDRTLKIRRIAKTKAGRKKLRKSSNRLPSTGNYSTEPNNRLRKYNSSEKNCPNSKRKHLLISPTPKGDYFSANLINCILDFIKTTDQYLTFNLFFKVERNLLQRRMFVAVNSEDAGRATAIQLVVLSFFLRNSEDFPQN